MPISINYNQLLKECFWDYNMSEEDIREIVASEDIRLKEKLFSKIIYNSTDKARTLKALFDEELLTKMFDSFTVSYNKKYIERYVLILKNILLKEENKVESLLWKKR